MVKARKIRVNLVSFVKKLGAIIPTTVQKNGNKAREKIVLFEDLLQRSTPVIPEMKIVTSETH